MDIGIYVIDELEVAERLSAKQIVDRRIAITESLKKFSRYTNYLEINPKLYTVRIIGIDNIEFNLNSELDSVMQFRCTKEGKLILVSLIFMLQEIVVVPINRISSVRTINKYFDLVVLLIINMDTFNKRLPFETGVPYSKIPNEMYPFNLGLIYVDDTKTIDNALLENYSKNLSSTIITALGFKPDITLYTQEPNSLENTGCYLYLKRYKKGLILTKTTVLSNYNTYVSTTLDTGVNITEAMLANEANSIFRTVMATVQTNGLYSIDMYLRKEIKLSMYKAKRSK